MATSMTSNTLECSICCEHFKTPKILNCGHTFCLECLESYIGERTVKFPCPVCGEIVEIPKGGVKKFITNFIAHSLTPTPLETQDTGTTTSTSTATNLTGDTNQTLPTIKHRCPQHSERDVEFYCKTCNEGVCARCIHLNHKNHESLDIECDDTKIKATEEVANLEKLIQQKINDLEQTYSTLQNTSEKLASLCDEECTKVTNYTEKVIKDLREKCEKTKSAIKQHFDENELKLTETRAKAGNYTKNLKVDLETKLPSSTEDSCLTILQSVPELTKLQEFSQDLIVTLPDITYSKWTETCDIKPNSMGQLETKTIYIPKLNEFVFSINEIKHAGVDYYSKNKYTAHGVVWSCSANQKNDYLAVFIELTSSDNPSIESCEIDRSYKLINHRGMDPVEKKPSKVTYTEESRSWGNIKFISWSKLIDKQQGFISKDDQFIIQFDIKEVVEIKMKTSTYN